MAYDSWLRLDTDVPANRKLRRLGEGTQLFFIWYLCLWKSEDVTEGTSAEDIAWHLRLDAARVAREMSALKAADLLLKNGKPKGWDKRQKDWDKSTDRVRRHREKMRREAEENDIETDDETDDATPDETDETLQERYNETDETVAEALQGNGSETKMKPHARVTVQDNTIQNNIYVLSDTGILVPSEESPESSMKPPKKTEAKKGGASAATEAAEFEKFWEAYPYQAKKKDALKAWKQTAADRPALAELLAHLERHKASHGWQKQEGQFIPLPASWLRGGCWNDAIKPDPGNGAAGKTVSPPKPPSQQVAPSMDMYK